MNTESFALLIEEHARFPKVLENLVQPSPAELLRSREREGRWSPLEILAHLRDEEIEDFRARAQAAAQGQPIELKIDPQGWVSERRYNELDPRAVLEDLARERALSCRWLESLEPETLERSVPDGGLAGMRCGDFIAAWRMHDLLHLRQLATALAVLSARRLEGWEVGYAGELPS